MLVPVGSVMARILMALLPGKTNGSFVTLQRHGWQSGRAGGKQAGICLFLSQERLWTAAKEQPQRQVPEMSCATADQMTSCMLAENKVSHIFTRWGTLAEERHTPFCYLL